MESCLNIEVSYFASKADKSPSSRNLLEVLQSSERANAVMEGRGLLHQQGESAYKAFKDNQPCYLISVLCEGGHNAGCIVGRTGLFGFDIDDLGGEKNPKWTPEEIKDCLACCTNVAYCGLSFSGNGIFGIVPVEKPERHTEYFATLKKIFIEIGRLWKGEPIVIDKSCGNPNRLRFHSYDPNPVWRHAAEPLAAFIEMATKEEPKPFDYTPDADKDRERVEVCIGEVVRQGTYLGDTYDDWYTVGCALANSFGEIGRLYFHHASQNYPDYESSQTDKQFTACLRANSKATLGSFFHLCQLIRIEWKELIPYVAPMSERSTQRATLISQQKATLNHDYILRPPLAWDAATLLRFIRWAVIPDGYDEQNWPPEDPRSIQF